MTVLYFQSVVCIEENICKNCNFYIMIFRECGARGKLKVGNLQICNFFNAFL